MSSAQPIRVVIIGGGIIGLSIAYELAKRDLDVTLLERHQLGRQASWAGAGIITPVNSATAIHPLEHLEAISHKLHEEWSMELLSRVGICNGFRRCGGLYVARTAGEAAALTGLTEEWAERDIAFEELSANETRTSAKLEILGQSQVRNAVWVAGESVFDNQVHLQALVAACRKLGVEIHDQLDDVVVEASDRRIELARSRQNEFRGDKFVLAAGPWTERLLEPIRIELPMQPVRGQIALYKLPSSPDGSNSRLASLTQHWPILNEGSRYLVPRADGRVIAGATIEEVGFNCQTTRDEILGLRNWAEGISTYLSDETFIEAWAGLRPATYDGFPYVGRAGQLDNAFIATGHFKSGLHLSTGTAVSIADLIEDKAPAVELGPFSPSRVSSQYRANIE